MNSTTHKAQRAVDLITRVQSVHLAKPSHQTMLDDIKMMKVQVRSVDGDIFSVKHTETQFIRSLWKVSKIEQIAREASDILDDIEVENFFSYLDTVNDGRPYYEAEKYPEDTSVVTLEVFKPEEPDSKYVN